MPQLVRQRSSFGTSGHGSGPADPRADGSGTGSAPHDGPWIEVAVGDDGTIRIRQSDRPDQVVVTTQAKWTAFVKGIKADEFDGFAEE
jgi:hypothetical protein